MTFLEILRVAFSAIRASKLRSFLTALGIVIGVGAVITMVALGSGAQAAVEEQLDALGTDLLSVTAGQSYWRGIASAERVSVTSRGLPWPLCATATLFKAVVPSLDRRHAGRVRRPKREHRLSWPRLRSMPASSDCTIDWGEMFTQSDDYGRRRVAVLGSDIPEELETDAGSLMGREIRFVASRSRSSASSSRKARRGGMTLTKRSTSRFAPGSIACSGAIA